MDTLEKQLLAVQEKVDALYQIIEQLNVKFSAAIDTGKVKLHPEAKDTVNINYSKYSNPWYQSYGDSSMEHKDVLKDHRVGESSSQASGQQAMSTELQIQRLTAQLTAAYNRIAALEEQLVARRVHH
jgi:hypothetical protein